MKHSTDITIKGMSCASCVARIEGGLNTLPGVKKATVNFAFERAHIEHDHSVSADDIIASVKKSGYTATIVQDEMNADEHADHVRSEKESEIQKRLFNTILAGVVTAAILIVMLLGKDNARYTMLLLAIISLWAGKEFFKVGYPALCKGSPQMDSLVAMGVTAAFVFSAYATLVDTTQPEYFMDVSIITFFILLGRYVEARAKGRASKAIEKLLTLSAKVAHRITENGIEDVPVDQIKVGDKLRVLAGEKFPVDGVLIEGFATIDESMITGESIPVEKTVGNAVIGATINTQTTCVMEAQMVGTQTTLARIIALVEQAQMSKAPIQKLADTISKYFVWVVIGVGVLTFAGWFMATGEIAHALIVTAAVFVIACPCALGLATPISIVVGMGRGASSGVLIKNAGVLERVHKITAIAFDKTGTITQGKPIVQTWIPVGKDVEQSLPFIRELESQSDHPLAKSVATWINKQGYTQPVQLSSVRTIPGKGIEGTYESSVFKAGSMSIMHDAHIDTSIIESQLNTHTQHGATIVICSKNTDIIGAFVLSDPLKETSKLAIDRLRKRHIKTIMLTGDSEAVAQHIAQQVGIDDVVARVLPDEKVNHIKALQKQGERVAMIGDGINDSPALAQADVGIAIGTGTDIAIESGDIVLINGDLQKAITAIELSEATLKNIKQNLFWAFAFNGIGIPLAAFGLLSPQFSALAMAFSSVFVVGNALRLRK